MRRNRHRIVVIGGGYVGTMAAVRAAGKTRGRAKVTLVDPDGTLVQRLRLHELATGRRVPAPALAEFCGHRVEHVRGWADSIDLAAGAVSVSGRSVPYDSLIVATGSGVDTASVPGAGEHAHALSDAAAARRLAADLERAPRGARVAVVGGGLTGLETASEIAEARPDLRVALVSRDTFGGRFSTAGRAHLAATFDRLGVEVLDGVHVDAVTAGALERASGPAIPFDLAVWCGGFVPRSLAADSGLDAAPDGGVLVDRNMRSVSHPEVLAAGDAAACPPLASGAGVRRSCQAGIPTGLHAADVVAASLRGREPEPFDFGYLAWSVSLGRRDALIQWVDRADRPKDRVTTGRPAVWVKALATAGPARSPRWEQRMPGVVRWPSAGAPVERDASPWREAPGQMAV